MMQPGMDAVTSLLVGRRARLERLVGRALAPLASGAADALPERARRHLLEEALDLYWNELEWENVTSEEALDEGSLTELAFPAFLSFVDGLLLAEPAQLGEPAGPVGSPAVRGAPRVEVVSDILRFLALRVLELEGTGEAGPDETRQARAELAMTSRLIDLVMYRLYDLAPEEIERLEAAGASDEAG